MNENNENFSYTYSPDEKKAIEKIRNKYVQKEENKLDTLKKLDKSVKTAAAKWAICVGVIGLLVMGIGMSICMSDFGSWVASFIKADQWQTMFVGIIIGLAGILITLMAYPVYKATEKRKHKAVANKILALTDELLGE